MKRSFAIVVLSSLLPSACVSAQDHSSAKKTRVEVASAGASATPEHCAHHAPLPASEPLPGKSFYQLQMSLTDQRGTALELATLRGQPVLVAMFYASCTSVCPMLIGKPKQIEQALAPELRARTRVLLISLDPEHDTVAKLSELPKQYAVDAKRWSFTRTSADSVREAAAVLGVRYGRMPDGAINHSPVIALLDDNGVIAARSEDVVRTPTELTQALTGLLSAVR